MLERIELKDFKSWRGHQTIGPFQPFTSIIGPNGSGKSNLMDAISFVLGITSAHLRSDRLRDLIYRGRRLRREDETQPGEVFDDADAGEGDAQDAWVKAVYKDEKGKEYTFQRSITMTGGSEYKLNGKVVTYSKYNAALEAHNILVKAKNFLVFQGDVEAVARQSPKDLCRLIEQISGSLELAKEYETTKAAFDKATALSTESFHSRREVAKEFKAFKEHQSESKRLTKLWQEKDEIVLQHVLWKLYHIQSGIDGASSSILSKNAELAKLRKEQGGVEREVAKARKEQAEVKTQISARERGLKGKEKSLDQEASRLVSLKTQIEHATRKIENSTTLSGKVRKDENRQQATVAELERNLAQVEQLAKEAEDEQRRLSQKKGQALSEQDLADYRQLKAKANTLLPAERAELDSLRRREKTLQQEIEGAEEKEATLRRKIGRLEGEVGDLDTRKDSVERKRENLENERSKAKKELDHLQSERTRIAQLETETNEKLQACYAKLIQAGADRKQSEKETRLKETIATLKRIFPGDVHGRVIDLCKPTQTKYQTAVSVVLGRHIDGIVVNHEKTAIECINYLRTQRLGQAMFLPLDSIQVKPTNDKYRTFARGARLAIDVIDYDPQFEAAMQHACGNSLICDTMDVARYVCYDKQQDVKAVTLEGTVIHKSGSITGGQSAQGAGRKWDEKEITTLQKQRDSLMNYLGELSKARPRGKSDDILLGDISRYDSELALVRDDLNATDLRLTSLRTELDHARKELNSTTAMLRDRRTSLASVEDESATIAETVNASEDEVFAAFCARIRVANIREYEAVQLRAAEQQTEARMRYTAQIDRLGRQLEFEREQLEHTRSRLRVLEKTLKADSASLDQLKADKDELEAQTAETEREIEQIKGDVEDLQAKLADVGTELDEIKRRSSKASKALDRISKDIAGWNDTIAKLGSDRASIFRRCKIEDLDLPLEEGSLADISLEELDAEDEADPMAMDVDEDEEGTQQPLRPRDFGVVVDFSDLADEDKVNGAEEHGEELEAEVARIEAEIQQMAPTSKAAEKMSGVQAKLNETEKQVEKARKESTAAREAFNAVRKQRTKLFNKAYTHIADRIDGVYKSLTKGNAAPMGGVAYLNLEDTEEPYLAGVKYHAMPPMKRFRDMDQLSGGEQTVAALALLLAIHSYRPAPFFVLDEVDAALDNTNVTRVARYLREHSSDAFQFLVISLKDTLYERSNALVGVYRDQDVNSSRALTLDLQQYDEQPAQQPVA